MPVSIHIEPTCLKQLWYDSNTKAPILGNPNDSACSPVASSITLSHAICPPSYYGACTPTTFSDQTVEHCCPNGYKCDGGYLSCSSNIGSTRTGTGTSMDADGNTVTTVIFYTGVNANSIAVQYGPSDKLGAITSATISPSQTGTIPTSTSEPGGDPATSQPAPLSTGAKAGIGVGVSLVFLVAMGLLVYFFRKRGSANARGVVSQQSKFVQGPQQQDYKPVAQSDGPQELAALTATTVHELETNKP